MENGFFVQVPNTAIMDDRLSDSQFKLLCILSTYLNEEGYCFPKTSTIEKKAKCSRATVFRNLKALSDFGFIKKVNLFRDDGGQTVSAYYINFNPVDKSLKNETEGGLKNETEGVSKMRFKELYTKEPYNYFKNNIYARTRDDKNFEKLPEATERDFELLNQLDEYAKENMTSLEYSFFKSVEIYKTKEGGFIFNIPTRFILEKLPKARVEEVIRASKLFEDKIFVVVEAEYQINSLKLSA